MPYTMQDFKRELAQGLWPSPPDPRTSLLEGLTLEERLAGLPPEQIEAYLKRLRKKSATSGKKKPKRGS